MPVSYLQADLVAFGKLQALRGLRQPVEVLSTLRETARLLVNVPVRRWALEQLPPFGALFGEIGVHDDERMRAAAHARAGIAVATGGDG